MQEPRTTDKRPHLVLSDTAQTHHYTAHTPKGGPEKHLPDLDRAQHGAALQSQLQAINEVAQVSVERQRELGLESGLGLQIQFRSQPDVALAFESLHNETSHIELLSVHTEGEYTYANVFVPDDALGHFEKYVTEYLEKKTAINGKSLDHKALLNTIESIRAAELRALWTDDPQQLPDNLDEVFWWEVWLPVRGQREQVLADFHKLAELAGWNALISPPATA